MEVTAVLKNGRLSSTPVRGRGAEPRLLDQGSIAFGRGRTSRIGRGEFPAQRPRRRTKSAHFHAGNIETAPAGGNDVLVIALVVFLVLLLTDILGYTQIFPFVKHGSAK